LNLNCALRYLECASEIDCTASCTSVILISGRMMTITY